MSEDSVAGYTRTIAKVRGTMLGFEDHGILTAQLNMDYGDAGQTIGGYSLDNHLAGEFIRRVLEAFGVSEWEKLKGRTIFVLSDGPRGRVEGIEPLPTEPGKRLVFREVFGDPS